MDAALAPVHQAARHATAAGAVDLAYEVSGERGRPALLLVHGGTASRRAWDLVTPALRASHRVVAVDLRGHGQSPTPDSGYSALQLGADIGRVIEQLRPGAITVVGHSLGGMAAIHLAAHRPELVRRLVLLNVPAAPRAVDALVRLERRVRDPGFFPLTQAFVDEWCAHPRPLPAAFVAAQQAHVRALPAVVWQQVFGELVQADLTPVLPYVRQPTLLLWGARDGLLDASQCERLQAGIANARRVVIDEAGHNPSSATPDRVAAEIAAFAG
ncbi:MAG: alpha/beta hydrolase [Burkholderiales bacterium]|nr:alpha/beta hydrolase [Burkholderiales bacterium]